MFKNTKQAAYTLVEMLTALIVVAILVAILSFGYKRMIDRSEMLSCLANRESILTAYSFYKAGVSNPMSLTLFLQNKDGVASAWLDKPLRCPSNGVYTAVDNNKVLCSVHSDATQLPDTPGGGSIVPGTDQYPGTDPVVVDGDWSTAVVPMPGGSENQYLLDAPQGTIFYNEETGKYYVLVSGASDMPIYLETPNLDPTAPGWPGWLSQTSTGIVEIVDIGDGNIPNADSIDFSTHLFQRGDVIYSDGAYYACMIQGGSQTTISKWNAPPNSYSWWYKLGN